MTITAVQQLNWRRSIIIAGLGILIFVLIALSLSVGSVRLSLHEIVSALLSPDSSQSGMIVWSIRFPRTIAAALTGATLGVAGCVMQNLLRNPLASPFTLGISQGAAFGAAIAIVLFGAGVSQRAGSGVIINNISIVVICAFFGALATLVVILGVAAIRQLAPSALILTGVALSSIFGAGTMFVQYLASDVQLAATIYWTFGDVGKAGWREVGAIFLVTVPALVYFCWLARSFNALEWGQETAHGLGVSVDRLRIWGMTVSTLCAAVVTALLGVIGFIGLISPHVMRPLIGHDHRFLIPASAAFGAVLLLGSDVLSRTLLAPVILPVGIITAFAGGPLFLFLLIRGGAKR